MRHSGCETHVTTLSTIISAIVNLISVGTMVAVIGYEATALGKRLRRRVHDPRQALIQSNLYEREKEWTR